MLYATNIFPGDGSTRQFEITFVGGYLNKSHVKVYVEDAVTKLRSPIDMGTVTWLGPYTIQVPAVTPVGSNTVVARETPLIPIVNFQGSSRITEANLDVAHRQGLFVATESLDNTNSQVVTELKEAILNSATWAESAEVSAAQALARANIATTQAMVADSKASEAATSASEAATSASEAATLVGALALPTGSEEVGHIAAGAGAVATTVQAQLRNIQSWTANAKDSPFYAKGDGVADDTVALTLFLNYCRGNKVKGIIPGGTYLTTGPLDISGVDIEGVLGGFNNSNGTIIKGAGSHILLNQAQTTSGHITCSLKNLALQTGTVGLRLTYSVHCRIENLFITDCTDGIYCGVLGILGPLWNNFKNCRVAVSGVALSVDGDSFANACIFDTCVLNGGVYGATITGGGLGALSNQFVNTEFLGAGFGVRLTTTKSTSFDNCYFESESPAVHINGFTLATDFNGCTFGSLKNTNASGVNSFIWHETGTCRVAVNGGYIYLPNTPDSTNLRFIRSDSLAAFALTMYDQPESEIAASGWSHFDSGLPNSLSRIVYQSSYIPAWSTSGVAPSLGNGTLVGRYALNGKTCTVQLEFVAGSTTTFGTGQFQFSLPLPTLSGGVRPQGVARVSDSGTSFYVGLTESSPGSSNAVVYTNNTPNLVQSNSPFAWTTNDSLRFTMTYEIG